jgi:hypothetical protein
LKLHPVLKPERYAFVEIAGLQPLPQRWLAAFREDEGISVVLRESDAREYGLTVLFSAAWITLTVDTKLSDTGITARFSQLLSDNGIGCNVFAAIRHDHIFVPFDDGPAALKLLSEIRL